MNRNELLAGLRDAARSGGDSENDGCPMCGVVEFPDGEIQHHETCFLARAIAYLDGPIAKEEELIVKNWRAYPPPEQLGPVLNLKMCRELDVFTVWVRTKTTWAVMFEKWWPLDDEAKERMAKRLIELSEGEFTDEKKHPASDSKESGIRGRVERACKELEAVIRLMSETVQQQQRKVPLFQGNPSAALTHAEDALQLLKPTK